MPTKAHHLVKGIPSDLLDHNRAGRRQLKVTALDRLHKRTHDGYVWALWKEFILNGTTPGYLIITVGEYEIHMQARKWNTDSSDMKFELYLNPEVVVGASPEAIPLRPMNYVRPRETGTIVTTVESFSGGTLIEEAVFYGADTAGNNTSGDDRISMFEMNFPPGAVIGVKAFRRSGSEDAYFNFSNIFYEVGVGE